MTTNPLLIFRELFLRTFTNFNFSSAINQGKMSSAVIEDVVERGDRECEAMHFNFIKKKLTEITAHWKREWKEDLWEWMNKIEIEAKAFRLILTLGKLQNTKSSSCADEVMMVFSADHLVRIDNSAQKSTKQDSHQGQDYCANGLGSCNSNSIGFANPAAIRSFNGFTYHYDFAKYTNWKYNVIDGIAIGSSFELLYKFGEERLPRIPTNLWGSVLHYLIDCFSNGSSFCRDYHSFAERSAAVMRRRYVIYVPPTENNPELLKLFLQSEPHFPPLTITTGEEKQTEQTQKVPHTKQYNGWYSFEVNDNNYSYILRDGNIFQSSPRRTEKLSYFLINFVSTEVVKALFAYSPFSDAKCRAAVNFVELDYSVKPLTEYDAERAHHFIFPGSSSNRRHFLIFYKDKGTDVFLMNWTTPLEKVMEEKDLLGTELEVFTMEELIQLAKWCVACRKEIGNFIWSRFNNPVWTEHGELFDSDLDFSEIRNVGSLSASNNSSADQSGKLKGKINELMVPRALAYRERAIIELENYGVRILNVPKELLQLTSQYFDFPIPLGFDWRQEVNSKLTKTNNDISFVI